MIMSRVRRVTASLTLACNLHSPGRIAAFQTSRSQQSIFVVAQRSLSVKSSSNNDNVVPSSITPEILCERAKDFIRYKNAAGRGESTLDPIFDMCSSSVDLYGLKGDEVRSGLIAFFDGHPGLHHELLEEPTSNGENSVQYPFVKSWKSDGEITEWSSIDPDKPRNKVERLDFDEECQLVRVAVVEASAPVG